jgi:menaquinone-dependent protoporphyrinogen IX oxidase
MRALVIYGTRWGGTVKIAEQIGAGLRAEGFSVDVVDAKDSPKTVDVYDLVVVGSGMRADKWTKASLAFLEKNSAVLQTKKTALFVSGQMADRKDEGYSKAKDQYLQKTADQYGLKPLSLGFFGGYLDFSYSHGLIVDVMVRVNRKSLRKNGLDTTQIYDTRDWAAIEAWARELAKLALQTA